MLSSAGMLVREWWYEVATSESSLSIISLIMSSSSSWLSEVEWPRPPSPKGCRGPRGSAERDMERCREEGREGSGEARMSPIGGIRSNLQQRQQYTVLYMLYSPIHVVQSCTCCTLLYMLYSPIHVYVHYTGVISLSIRIAVITMPIYG